MIDKNEKKKQGRTLLTQTTELPFLRREERRRETKTLKRLYVWLYRCNSARVGKKNFFFFFFGDKMQKTLLGLDQLQNYLIRGFSILIILIIYGLGSIRAKLMKVNPLYQRKMYNVSVQITKIPKKQRNERIKEHKRQNRYSLPTKRQLSRTNLNRLPPPFEIHSHQIPLPFLQQHFQLGPFVLSFFSQIYKHIHSNAPNFEPKPNCQSFFTSQIEPSHQDNLDTTKNRGRKSRNKGIQRERGGQRLLVVVVALKGSAMAETRERIRDSRERK